METTTEIKARLEYLRGEIDAERVSMGEIVELQSLVPYIEDGDVVLLQWAGVPEDGALQLDKGGKVERIDYRWQYCQDGQDITGQPLYAEDDADEARAWQGAHGDLLVAALERVGDRWRFTTSDMFGAALPGESVTFADPRYALRYLTETIGVLFVTAQCRCGEPGEECD